MSYSRRGRVTPTEWWISKVPGAIYTIKSLLGIQEYLKYIALLTQINALAPVATILENTLGEEPVWSYDSDGSYYLSASINLNLFPADRTVLILGSPVLGDTSARIARGGNDILHLETRDTGVLTNNMLTGTYIEIRVYPEIAN